MKDNHMATNKHKSIFNFTNVPLNWTALGIHAWLSYDINNDLLTFFVFIRALCITFRFPVKFSKLESFIKEVKNEQRILGN